MSDVLEVAGRKFNSRLIIGTGKYKTYEENARAAEAAGAEMVTVAVRRVNLTDKDKPMLVDFLDPEKYVYLPNTAGCFTAEDAIRTLRLAREAGGWELVKLEVLADQKTLYPEMEETLRAAKLLIKEGFDVMVYCSDDPVYARKLEDAGCCAIMPLGSLIGSGLGIMNPVNIRLRARHCRRGRRHGVGRDRRHGARLRRRVDEYGHCGSQRSDPDGERHEARRHCRP